MSEVISYDKMAGHWILAKLGKRVLRPGGAKLSEWMLETLKIKNTDDVLELAPGIGATARKIFEKGPKTYTAIDREKNVIEDLSSKFKSTNRNFIETRAEEMSFSENSYSVILGEAYLTMQANPVKEKIVSEIYRVLKINGRYGLHELCVDSDNEERAKKIKLELSKSIRVNASPLTKSEWENMLQKCGFKIEAISVRPMSLLRIKRVIEDEGLLRFLKFSFNLLLNPEARKRVLEMRKVFEEYKNELSAISIVASKSEVIH